MNKHSTRTGYYIIGLFVVLAVVLLLLSIYRRDAPPPIVTVVSQVIESTNQPDSSTPSPTPTQTIVLDTSATSSPTSATTTRNEATALLPPTERATVTSPTTISTSAETKITSTSSPTPSPISIITQETVTESPTEPTKIPVVNMPPAIKTYNEVQKEGGVTVDGYTFSLPQKVTVTGLGRLLDIEGWLPDSPDEIIGVSDDKIVGIDVYSGQIRFFSHESARGIKPDSINLLKDDQVAFLTFNTETKQATDLWISGADEHQAHTPVFGEAGYDKVTTSNGENLILYSQDTPEMKVLGQDGIVQQADITIQQTAIPSPLLQTESQADILTGYRVTPSPNGQWIMFDGGANFYLANQKTGEAKQITLDKKLRAMTLRWSPDGQRLALLVTEGPAPIPYTKLFILEVGSEEIREITTEFQYITNVTWAPDSQHSLISADTGTGLTTEGFEYSTGELFLVDIISGEIRLIPVFHPNSRIDFVKKLSWSPDGQKIVLSGFVPDNTSLLHRIDVIQP